MVNYLPSQATTQITVTTLDVGTILTIAAPSTIVQGQIFRITGDLRRVDTNTVLGGETITVSYNGTIIGSDVTAANGEYNIDGVINEMGTWTLTANFAGAVRPGLILAPSMAKARVALAGITQYLPYIIPAAILGWLIVSKK